MAARALEIDEDLHSSQLAVYGCETMKRLFEPSTSTITARNTKRRC